MARAFSLPGTQSGSGRLGIRRTSKPATIHCATPISAYLPQGAQPHINNVSYGRLRAALALPDMLCSAVRATPRLPFWVQFGQVEPDTILAACGAHKPVAVTLQLRAHRVILYDIVFGLEVSVQTSRGEIGVRKNSEFESYQRDAGHVVGDRGPVWPGAEDINFWRFPRQRNNFQRIG